MKIDVPKALMASVANKIQVLLEAIEAESNLEHQISFRMLVGSGTFDSTERGEFQIIVELCVDDQAFIKDGDIEIITQSQYKELYKQAHPLTEQKAIIYGLEEGCELWESEYKSCRAILTKLVNLKNLKDAVGKTSEYRNLQPLVWEEAKEFLSKYQHQ